MERKEREGETDLPPLSWLFTHLCDCDKGANPTGPTKPYPTDAKHAEANIVIVVAFMISYMMYPNKIKMDDD